MCGQLVCEMEIMTVMCGCILITQFEEWELGLLHCQIFWFKGMNGWVLDTQGEVTAVHT